MKSEPLPNWCATVKKAMIDHNDMGVTDLAKGIGYSRNMVSLVINGGMEPCAKLRDAIEQYLGLC